MIEELILLFSDKDLKVRLCLISIGMASLIKSDLVFVKSGLIISFVFVIA